MQILVVTFRGPLDNINGFVGGSFNGFLYVNGQKQANSSFLAFSLTDFTQQALASTALPTSLNLLSFDTNERVGCIYDAASGGRVDFSVNPASPPANAVTIDVKPGSFPNSINPKSKGKTPVAIVTTGPSDNVPAFDATTVNQATILFGATGTEASPVQYVLEDVDRDGDTDMILHFNTQDTGIKCGDAFTTLTGETYDGQKFTGSDSIKTVGCK